MRAHVIDDQAQCGVQILAFVHYQQIEPWSSRVADVPPRAPSVQLVHANGRTTAFEEPRGYGIEGQNAAV